MSPKVTGLAEGPAIYLPMFVVMIAACSRAPDGGDKHWVRLFHVALDGSNSDHLTNRSIGGFDGSGSGIAPSA